MTTSVVVAAAAAAVPFAIWGGRGPSWPWPPPRSKLTEFSPFAAAAAAVVCSSSPSDSCRRRRPSAGPTTSPKRPFRIEGASHGAFELFVAFKNQRNQMQRNSRQKFGHELKGLTSPLAPSICCYKTRKLWPYTGQQGSCSISPPIEHSQETQCTGL